MRCLAHSCIQYTTHPSGVYVVSCLCYLLTRGMADPVIPCLLLFLGGAEVQLEALRHERQARPGKQHNTEHAELRFLPEIILL